MKLTDILNEGGSGSGRPSSKDRPDANLWFQQRELWMADLRRELGGKFDLLETEDEDEGDIFATDKDHKVCYGAWRKDLDQGITFAKPVPLEVVSHRRMTLKQMIMAPPANGGM